MSFDDLTPENVNQLIGDDGVTKVDVIVDFDGKNKMLVKADSAVGADLAILQEFSVGQSLPFPAYFDIFTDTGAKTISGYQLQFDDNDIEVRLEIDGSEIFNIDCGKLKEISDWNTSSLPSVYISWNDANKVFFFTPSFPMKSLSSVKIQARSNGGKKYEASIIQVG